jgi:hypothetical protein
MQSFVNLQIPPNSSPSDVAAHVKHYLAVNPNPGDDGVIVRIPNDDDYLVALSDHIWEGTQGIEIHDDFDEGSDERIITIRHAHPQNSAKVVQFALYATRMAVPTDLPPPEQVSDVPCFVCQPQETKPCAPKLSRGVEKRLKGDWARASVEAEANNFMSARIVFTDYLKAVKALAWFRYKMNETCALTRYGRSFCVEILVPAMLWAEKVERCRYIGQIISPYNEDNGTVWVESLEAEGSPEPLEDNRQ